MASSSKRTVGDYVTLVRGTTYKGILVGEPGPALLGLGSIVPGGGFRADYKTYGGECPPQLTLVPGDIYASLKGATKDGKMIGSVARVPAAVPVGRLTQDTVKLVFRNANRDDASYLYWLLRTPQYRDYCSGRATGSAVVALSRDDFLSYPVPPATPDRRRAVALFDAIEERIELNRRMNEILEAMAWALFKSWFSDFDADRVTVANLVADGVLEIGDGYRAKNDELGTPGLPFIRAGNLDGGFDVEGAEFLRDESAAKAGGKVSRVHDVAFTSKGTIGRFARVSRHTPRFVYSPQVCYWRSLDESRLHPAILYCWMLSEDLGHQIASVAGQTDMAPYVSLRDQRGMLVPVFPTSQHAVARAIEPLFERQASNSAESKTLTRLRDALLPKLISGELRVDTAEQAVAMTAR